MAGGLGLVLFDETVVGVAERPISSQNRACTRFRLAWRCFRRCCHAPANMARGWYVHELPTRLLHTFWSVSCCRGRAYVCPQARCDIAERVQGCVHIISVTTLGELRKEGWVVYAHCGARYCGRGRRLELDRLIRIFGPHHVFIGDTQIASRLRCECGHRGGTLRYCNPGKNFAE